MKMIKIDMIMREADPSRISIRPQYIIRVLNDMIAS